MSRTEAFQLEYLKEHLYTFNDGWFQKKTQEFDSNIDYKNVNDPYIAFKELIVETAGEDYSPSYEIKKIYFHHYCWNAEIPGVQWEKETANFQELVLTFSNYFNNKIETLGDTYLQNDFKKELDKILQDYRNELKQSNSTFSKTQETLMGWLFDETISSYLEKLSYLETTLNLPYGLTIEKCRRISELRLFKQNTFKDFYSSPTNILIEDFLFNLFSANPKFLKGYLEIEVQAGFFYLIIKTLIQCEIPINIPAIETTKTITIKDKNFRYSNFRKWHSTNKHLPSLTAISDLLQH